MACQVEDPKTCTVTPNGSASPFNPTKPQKLRRLCSIDSQQDSDCWHKPQDDEVGFQIRFPSMPVPSNISYNDYMLSNCHVTCGPLDKLLGYDEDQVGHSLDWFQERFHPDDANTFDEICDHFARKENAGSADARHLKRSYRFKTYDGRWLLCGERINTVRKNGFPIFSEGYLSVHLRLFSFRATLRAARDWLHHLTSVSTHLYFFRFMIRTCVEFLHVLGQRNIVLT